MAKGLFMAFIFGLMLWVPLDLVYCWFSGSPSFFAYSSHFVFVITIMAGFLFAVGLIMVGDWVWRHMEH